MRLEIRCRTGEGGEQQFTGSIPFCLRADGTSPGSVRPEALLDEVIAMPIGPIAGAICAILVPDGMAGTVWKDRLPLRGGLYLLGPGTELKVRDQLYWIAADTTPEQTSYEPGTHGEDLCCHLTRAPLSPGEAIVVCPGLPGVACGLLYRATAWRTAVESGLACPACGYRQRDEEVSPRAPARDDRLSSLLHMLKEGGER